MHLHRRGITATAAAIAIAITLARAAPAAADGEPGAGTVVGLGFGPGAHLGGALGERFSPDGATGRLRLGGRVARVAFELTTSFAGLRGGDLDRPGYMMATPSIGYLPLAQPHLQLLLRAGLGYGVISGERTRPAPPCLEAPCAGPATDIIDHRGYGLELGATGAVHLGRRHGGRAVLWADIGLSLVRFQLPDTVVGGEVVIVTVGVAHGMEM